MFNIEYLFADGIFAEDKKKIEGGEEDMRLWMEIYFNFVSKRHLCIFFVWLLLQISDYFYLCKIN